MMRRWNIPRLLLGLMLVVVRPAAGTDENWPEFRGPSGQGHAQGELPLHWSDRSHIKYKTAIPGRGWSSPVVFGSQVWMTTATDDGGSLRAVCVDRDSGRIVHDLEVFHVAAPQRINAFNSYASPSPLIEKGRLYVCFGDEGNACIDTDSAKVIWKNQELRVQHMEGAGSSPVIYGNLYILNCDGADTQYVAALNKLTGKLAWKTERSTPFPTGVIGPFRKAFGTPLIIRAGGRDQLISPGARRISSYDPLTGRELWYVDLEPPAYNTAPRPIYANGVVYVCTGFDHAHLLAIRVDDKSAGDVTATHVVWDFTRGVPLKPSPLLVGNELYLVSDNGIVRCLDAKDGDEIWRSRIGGAFSASPIDAGGRLYFFGEAGRSLVLRAGREFNLLADNYLNDGGCMATPAVSGNAIFLRSKTHLFRIEQ